MNLYALDVNSGVEDMPGVKSADKLKALFSRLP
jgi:phosphoribosylanthranilate isomerase